MPKKRTGKALLIKPGSQSTIASSSASHHHDTARPSVNDLIRESRRLQLSDQSVPSPPPITSSIHPQVRHVLNLPTPEAPPPRPGIRRVRPTPLPHNERGPSRIRTVPGPPPPKSWLINSRHAPATGGQDAYQTMRTLDHPIPLPGITFPAKDSLQDYALKELATNWEWHVEYDGMYLTTLPIKLREVLLSYLPVYNEQIQSNPIRMLFLAESDVEDHKQVTRLDLTHGLGTWLRLKQLEKDLTPPALPSLVTGQASSTIPESWDDTEATLPTSLTSMHTFPHLRHLSLKLSPTNPVMPSWTFLLHLLSSLPPLASLSLAFWPYPTYTPRAASTHVTIPSSSPAHRITYGGTSLYSSTLDNNLREPAGILRSLSHKTTSLTYLDLTGCGAWWDALVWSPLPDEETLAPADAQFFVGHSPSDNDEAEHGPESTTVPGTANTPRAIRPRTSLYAPDFTTSWRALSTLVLKIGYTPIRPQDFDAENGAVSSDDWDPALARRQQGWKREEWTYNELVEKREGVVHALRERRRGAGWLEIVM